jgi:hypothetical protein
VAREHDSFHAKVSVKERNQSIPIFSKIMAEEMTKDKPKNQNKVGISSCWLWCIICWLLKGTIVFW